MFNLPKEIIIFDTEYTSWEGAIARDWTGSGEHKEIVQIGAICVGTDSLTEKDNLVLFVRPKINPKLSEYFINLTGITQEVIEKQGIPYPEALDTFSKWSRGLTFYSWGNDLKDLKENADLLKIKLPFDDTRFRDVRDIFRENGIETEGYMSSTSPKMFGEESKFIGHDGLNDSRSILQALQALARANSLL